MRATCRPISAYPIGNSRLPLGPTNSPFIGAGIDTTVYVFATFDDGQFSRLPGLPRTATFYYPYSAGPQAQGRLSLLLTVLIWRHMSLISLSSTDASDNANRRASFHPHTRTTQPRPVVQTRMPGPVEALGGSCQRKRRCPVPHAAGRGQSGGPRRELGMASWQASFREISTADRHWVRRRTPTPLGIPKPDADAAAKRQRPLRGVAIPKTQPVRRTNSQFQCSPCSLWTRRVSQLGRP